MGRSPCCDEMDVKKGPWTPEEDKKLMDYIQKNGHGSWRNLPKGAGLSRCGKSCRLRWTNYLRPDIKRGKFSEEEERLIIHLHSILGNKWSMMAARLPGRTDNEIKNYWNTHLKKKLLLMGIDPVTHRRRTDLDVLMNCFPSILAAAAATTTRGNTGSMDNAIRLQADAANLARFQMLQTLIQTMTSSPPLPPLLPASPNIDALNLLASFSLRNHQLDLQLEGIMNGFLALGQDQMPTLNLPSLSSYTTSPQLNHSQQQAGSNAALQEGAMAESPLQDPSPSAAATTVESYNSRTCDPAALNNSAAAPTAQSTPSLMSTTSSENPDADCAEEPSNSHSSSPLDAYWQGLNLERLEDDLTWRDMLDQISWPNDQFYSNLATNHGGAGGAGSSSYQVAPS